VIRLLTDQPEVTEELVVTASGELGISRSLVVLARRKIPDGSGQVGE
jgi:hypothetical protein